MWAAVLSSPPRMVGCHDGSSSLGTDRTTLSLISTAGDHRLHRCSTLHCETLSLALAHGPVQILRAIVHIRNKNNAEIPGQNDGQICHVTWQRFDTSRQNLIQSSGLELLSVWNQHSKCEQLLTLRPHHPGLQQTINKRTALVLNDTTHTKALGYRSVHRRSCTMLTASQRTGCPITIKGLPLPGSSMYGRLMLNVALGQSACYSLSKVAATECFANTSDTAFNSTALGY